MSLDPFMTDLLTQKGEEQVTKVIVDDNARVQLTCTTKPLSPQRSLHYSPQRVDNRFQSMPMPGKRIASLSLSPRSRWSDFTTEEPLQAPMCPRRRKESLDLTNPKDLNSTHTRAPPQIISCSSPELPRSLRALPY